MQAETGTGIVDMLKGADIWPQLVGSDHCPSWADFEFPTDEPMQSPASLAFSTRNTFTGEVLNTQPDFI